MVSNDAATLFNEIYDGTNQKVLLFITCKCGQTADINDIFQETYMELYKVIQKEGATYIKNHEAFVMKLAKRKIFKFYSAAEKVKSFIPCHLPTAEKDLEATDFFVDDYSFENDIADKEILEAIVGILNEKPEEVKKIFYLFYYMEMSIPDIAKSLNLSESTVKNKLYRTLKELRKLYQ